MLWDDNIDLNTFKSNILSGAIEDYRFDFEDSRDSKGEMSNPK